MIFTMLELLYILVVYKTQDPFLPQTAADILIFSPISTKNMRRLFSFSTVPQ